MSFPVYTILKKKSATGFPPGLIHYYNFDEVSGNLLDLVGGNHGTLFGPTQGVTGKLGSAYGFNGSSNYIEFESDNLDLSTTNFSISCWIKRSGGSGSQNTILDKRDSGPDGVVYYIAPDNRLTAVINGSNLIRSAGAVIDTETFHHMVLTVDRVGGTASMYLDAVSGGNVNISSIGNINVTTNMRMGKRGFGTDFGYFNGILDELKIWNVALSSSEVSDMFNE